MNTYAIDFETYYDEKVSIKTLGVHNYLHHPDCVIYRVSVVGEGLSWVGHPDDAPWEQIDGHRWVAHNAAFDRAVYDRLTDLWADSGHPNARRYACPAEWGCTANLAVSLDAPRNLAGAAKVLLNVAPDKTTRTNMLGKLYDDLPDDDEARAALTIPDIPRSWMGKDEWKTFTAKRREAIPTKEELDRYALTDAELCYRLWAEYAGQVSDVEKAVSEHTTLMVTRGVGVDVEGVEKAHDMIQTALCEARNEIPWVDEEGVKLLSASRLEKELSRHGLPIPDSTNKSDDAFHHWLEDHADDAPFVRAYANLRTVTKVAATVESMLARSDRVNGRLYYDLKFAGAHTGRWSGAGGINVQNFPRPDTTTKLGLPVDVRSLLKAPPGRVFVIADYSQIEARVALWLAKDHAQLSPIADGMDIYEAHARATMGYKDPRPLKEVDPDTRQLAKARVLGLGFGCGAVRFQNMARTMVGLVLTEEQCQQIVADYRASNYRIVQAWKHFQLALRAAYAEKERHLSLRLPSGRRLHYYRVRGRHDPVKKRHQIVADYERGVSKEAAGHNLYGGLLFENVVQATARDILAPAILRVEAAGYPVVLHVHDEIICEVPEEVAEEARGEIVRIMTEPLGWTEGLPLAAEAHIEERYTK